MGQLLALLQRHRQFILYAIIGASGVTIDIAAFFITTEYLGWGVLLANFFSITLGIINNFFLNVRYNFRVTDRLWERFWLFYGVGVLGLLMSEALLGVFHYGLSLDGLTAKALTLLPVLIFQFLLNRRFSFGDLVKSQQQIGRVFFHYPLYLLILLYALSSLVVVKNIPTDFSKSEPNYAPDESVHYHFNVKYIRDNWSLPVSGRDDLEAYRACRDNPSAQVTCTYSYVIFPAPAYVAAAVSSVVLEPFGLSPVMGARTVSYLSGILLVIFSYLIVFRITRRRLFAAALAAAVAFIPQVIFTNSYLNLDAYSLGISAVAAYTLIRFMQEPRSKAWQLFCAIAVFGLLPVTKYNYFPLIPAALGLITWVLIKEKFTRQEILRLVVWSVLSFLIIAGFWYGRNLVLYHDPLGQGFVLQKMAEFHGLGPTRGFDGEGLVWLMHHRFFEILFNSFFFALGGMFHYREVATYEILRYLLILSAVIFAAILGSMPNKKEQKLVALSVIPYGFVFIATLGLVMYNSLTYDFQPQGRYMFPVIVPTIVLLAFALRKDKRFSLVLLALSTITFFLFFTSISEFVRAYFELLPQ